jgi:bacterioferritin (cytochrome b1)
MKGNEKLFAMLDQVLADKLSAINMYMVHSYNKAINQWG